MRKVKHKFRLNDLVFISEKMPSYMTHFSSGVQAIIVERDSDLDEYVLHIKHEGECAWYPAEVLTLVSSNNGELLDKWEDGNYESIS